MRFVAEVRDSASVPWKSLSELSRGAKGQCAPQKEALTAKEHRYQAWGTFINENRIRVK